MPAHGSAPQTLSSDKHVDVCVDSDEDRGSTPLASTFIGKATFKIGRLTTVLTTSPPTSSKPMQSTIHEYEARPRKDHRGVDLISDALPFGRLWYAGPDAVNDAITYALDYERVRNHKTYQAWK